MVACSSALGERPNLVKDGILSSNIRWNHKHLERPLNVSKHVNTAAFKGEEGFIIFPVHLLAIHTFLIDIINHIINILQNVTDNLSKL